MFAPAAYGDSLKNCCFDIGQIDGDRRIAMLVVQCCAGCSVSVVVGRRTRDREVASSVPGPCIVG